MTDKQTATLILTAIAIIIAAGIAIYFLLPEPPWGPASGGFG